jgi:hypothetical protein
MIKSFYFNKKLKQNLESLEVKGYPQRVKHIGLFCQHNSLDVENFIFKIQKLHLNIPMVTVFEFDKISKDKEYFISKKQFDLQGNFKKRYIGEEISNLDLVIDITEDDGLVKNYAISLATRAYKISLGYADQSQFHLSIKLNSSDLNEFYREVEKYHNILKHG